MVLKLFMMSFPRCTNWIVFPFTSPKVSYFFPCIVSVVVISISFFSCQYLILPVSCVSFYISHILSADTRSVHSWNGNHPPPTGQSHSKERPTVSEAPAFLPFPFLCFYFPVPECVTTLSLIQAAAVYNRLGILVS